MMKINVCDKEYNIKNDINNVLDCLIEIKKNLNSSLAFKYGCKSGVCGSCAVLVNGVEKLACNCKINNEDSITPLNNLKIIRDLVVDDSNVKVKLIQSSVGLSQYIDKPITNDDVNIIDVQSNCILCNACYSSCPVYAVNDNFIGPFALTRAYRYIHDNKENEIKTKLESIQDNGVWDCTLCGYCSEVCPKNIDIKNDIVKLQNDSVQNGFSNPLFSSDSSFSNDDFGFNPNNF